MAKRRNVVSEMLMWTLDASRSIIMAPWSTMGAIRSGIRAMGMRFWPQGIEASDAPIVNYDITRSLYRNDGEQALGSGFCKPIVDLQVGFIGLPIASTDDEARDDYLNECVQTYWAQEIQEMIRDSLRDSKTIVRVRRPDIDDPLMTVNEAAHCQLEVITPERVEIERNVANKNIIERAVISHKMLFVEDQGNVAQGQDPQVREHAVLEIITKDRFRFYDKTDEKELSSLSAPNRDGFVPLEEVFNEWDSALQDGQSEFEGCMPFIQAFHDLMKQGLQAHKYHSTPKLKLKLDDVTTFLKNNWPDVFDPGTNAIREGATIQWQGREILFFQTSEDAEFIEAKSVLGDTKTLAEFLIDCICIASQTPEWAFMRVDSGSANSDRNAQTVPLVKKIDRKRRNYTRPIQNIMKMAMVMQGETPVRANLTWDVIRTDDEVVYWQAFQQLVMGLEVAKQAGEISDETYMKMLKQFLPAMKPTLQERKDADADKKKAVQDAQKAIAATSQPTNGSGPPQNVPQPVAGGPQGKNE